MRYFLFLVFFIGSQQVFSQSGEDSVKAVLKKLFIAMKDSDSAAVIACFTDSAIFQNISETKEGKSILKTEKLTEFASLIKHLQKGDADERIIIDYLKVDAALATVSAPYKFYYKGKFSHCGVDSFQFIRENGIWKIQYLIYSIRKQGCE